MTTASHEPPAVQVRGLCKRFGDVEALAGVDLAIQAGTVFGVLGPNGAGKTTLIRILATLLAADGGTAAIHGHDVATDGHAVRARIGLTGQFAGVDEAVSGEANLVLLGRLRGLSRAAAAERAAQLLHAFGLRDAGRRPVKGHSGGMRRRLDIACSLVVVPRVLFLDEPTTGLDPRSRNHVWDVVRGLAAAGTTVVLTTQYLAEAEALADRAALIDGGHVVAQGTVAELRRRLGDGVGRVRLRDPADGPAAVAAFEGCLAPAAGPGLAATHGAVHEARTPGGPSGPSVADAAGVPSVAGGPSGPGAADVPGESGTPGAPGGPSAAGGRLAAWATGAWVERDGADVALHGADEAAFVRGVAALERRGIRFEELAYGRPSLDEVFLALTGDAPTHETPEGAAA